MGNGIVSISWMMRLVRRPVRSARQSRHHAPGRSTSTSRTVTTKSYLRSAPTAYWTWSNTLSSLLPLGVPEVKTRSVEPQHAAVWHVELVLDIVDRHLAPITQLTIALARPEHRRHAPLQCSARNLRANCLDHLSKLALDRVPIYRTLARRRRHVRECGARLRFSFKRWTETSERPCV